MNIVTVLILFVSACLLGMVVIYISQLHAKLEFTNQEHVKLLHGMHEGLLIFNRQQDSIMFSNKPAKKLFDIFFKGGLFESKQGRKVVTTNKFYRLKKDKSKSDRTQPNSNESDDVTLRDFNLEFEKESMNLEQIIACQQD